MTSILDHQPPPNMAKLPSYQNGGHVGVPGVQSVTSSLRPEAHRPQVASARAPPAPEKGGAAEFRRTEELRAAPKKGSRVHSQ